MPRLSTSAVDSHPVGEEHRDVWLRVSFPLVGSDLLGVATTGRAQPAPQ